jgi:osmotically-inducible protein OsmY
MKKFVWLMPLLFGLNVLLIGCDERGQKPSTETGQSTAPSASKMSDSDLEKAVQARLESDAQLKEAKLDVDANADKNQVTLSGTVRSEEMRIKAVELARGVQSGLTVNDKIDVKPAA